MYTKPFSQLSKKDADIAGGKGASLGEMINAGIPVPDGFVVLSTTFDEFLHKADLIQEVDAILKSVDHKAINSIDKASEKIQELIKHAIMPDDIKAEIESQFVLLDAEFVAVRSSATAEDGADHAWAGQLESYLNTTKDTLLEKVQHCWASLFTPRAIFYRFEKGLDTTKISVAVVVQKMVNSEKSGIAFSVHPVTEDRNQLIIEAGFGLGEAIVSGSVTPDSYVVSKQPREIIDINVSNQTRAMYRKAGGGNEWFDIPDKGETQVFIEPEILELSKIIMTIENHYGFPCDIEWAYEAGKFYIVQSRPITTLAQISNTPEEALPLNSKEEIFIWGPVAMTSVIAFTACFSGLFKQFPKLYPGHSWPKLLTLFKDRQLVWLHEQQQLEENGGKLFLDEMLPLQKRENSRAKWKQACDTLTEIETQIGNTDLKSISNDELVKIWHTLHQAIDSFWAWSSLPELANYGSIKILQEKIQGTVPALELNSVMEILTAPEGLSFYQEEEIDLAESTDLDMHQAKYFWLKNSYTNVDVLSTSYFADKKKELSPTIRKEIETRLNEVRKKKADLQAKYSFSKEVMDIANAIVDAIVWQDERKRDVWIYLHYENLLLEEISSRFGIAKEKLLLLVIDEMEDFLKGNKKIEDFADREKGTSVFINDEGDLKIYGENLTTRYWNTYVDIVADKDINNFTGITASKGGGKVQGKVRIIMDAHNYTHFDVGDILVTSMTTPEYVFIMKQAGAVVTDTGGLTSHAAIVSRELGVPCIVNTKIATKILKDGDLVEVDANTGIVKIIKQNKKVTWEKVLQRNFPPLAWTAGGYYEFHGLNVGPMTWIREREMQVKYNTVQSYMIQDPNAFYTTNINNLIQTKNVEFENAIDIENQKVMEIVEMLPGNTLSDLYKLSENHKLAYGLMLIGFDVAIDIRNQIDKIIENKDEGFETYLATPWKPTAIQREQLAATQAKIDIEKNSENKSIVLEKLATDFGYIHQDYLGKPWTVLDYEKSFSDNITLQSGMDESYNLSKLNEYELWLVTIFKKMTYMYEEGRNAMVRTVWAMKETAKHIGLDPEILLYMTANEVEQYSLGKIEGISNELVNARKKAFAVHFDNGVYSEYSGEIEVKGLIERENIGFIWEEKNEATDTLKGSIAFKGYAKGRVRLVFTQEDANHVEEGEILVSPMTQVEFLSGIRKCAAIVTDEGGIICHAAIVSREFSKPCILATGKATKVLKNGDLVEVDANTGIVRILS